MHKILDFLSFSPYNLSMSEYTQNYYETHREERKLYQRIYNETHKEQIRNWKRNRLIHYQDSKKDILVTNKHYPEDERCQACGRKPKGVISYHHSNNPNNGIWLCFSCHMALHRLIKNPKLLQLIRVASLIDD